MSTNKNKYKVIFFDWNKTLSTSLFWEQLKDSHHPRHSWYSNISNYLFAGNKHLINDWMRGSIDENDIVESISTRFNYSKTHLLQDLADSCRKMKFVASEIIHFVRKIRRRGVKCVIATDNMDVFTKYTVPALKLNSHFDDILVSFEKKTLKFDIKTNENKILFFDDYLKENGFAYTDVVLMDDCIDRSGFYDKLGFKIIQISDSNDFVKKLKNLAK